MQSSLTLAPLVLTFLQYMPWTQTLLRPQFRTHRLWSWCRWTLLSSGKGALPLPSALTLLFCSTVTGVTLQAAAQPYDANIKYILRTMEWLHYGWCVCFAKWCTFVALTEYWEEANLTFWEIVQKDCFFSSWTFHCNNVFLIYHRMFRTN